MKKLSLLTGIVLLLLHVSCKKENAANATNPDIVLQGSGYLCTVGSGAASFKDTMVYRWSTGLGQELIVYGKGFQTADQHVSFEKRSDNSLSIKRSKPYLSGNGKYYTYLGTQANPNPAIALFPHDYLIYHYENAIDETEFIVKRSSANINNFTIESNKHPGNFLGSARYPSPTATPEPKNLVFTSTQQEFFFMQD